MIKPKDHKSRYSNRPGTVQRARLSLSRIALTSGGLLAVFVIVTMAWTAWQRSAASRSEITAADLKAVALADIPGNIAKGQRAPDFTVRTMGGGKFALADHAGQPTIIMFSAAWCGSCLFEAKNLAQVYTKYKDHGLNIIILDADPGDTDADVQRFRQAVGNPDYVWAFDDNYTLTQAFSVRALDTTVLIDQAGKIVYRDEYPTPLEPLLQAVAAVLP